MDNNTVRYFALISMCNARIEGMKAENMIRESLGQSMAYTDTEFFREAAELERLAHEVMQS